MDAVLRDPRTAPLSEAEKVLFVFLEKVNENSTRIGQSDVDAVKKAGWSDEAVYDALTVCALFNFYNIWIDATGVHDMPAEAYRASGQRLSQQGYVMPGE